MAIPFSQRTGGTSHARRLSSPYLSDRLSWLRVLGAFVLLSLLASASLNASPPSPSARKEQAREQFDKAEQMREALNGRPADQRSRKDYQRVADAYRKVY